MKGDKNMSIVRALFTGLLIVGSIVELVNCIACLNELINSSHTHPNSEEIKTGIVVVAYKIFEIIALLFIFPALLYAI